MSVAVRAASLVPRLVVRHSNARLWLAVWGVLAALYGGTHLTRHVVFPVGSPDATSPYLLPAHAAEVSASERVLDRGGPLLLGSRVPYGTSQNPSRDYSSLGQGDQGLYVILPLMGEWLGLTNPGTALRWLLIALFAPLLALYPLLFYELTGSTLVAALSPFVLLRTVDAIDGLDVYWLSAWTTLAFVPLLLFTASRWSFKRAAVLGAIVFAASLASTVRSGAGLVVLAVALAVSLVVERTAQRRAALVAVCGVAWIAGGLGPTALEHHRDHVVGVKVADVRPSIWQTVYAGLGWIDNPYGIAYGPAAVSAGESEHRLARLVEHEPGFVLDAFATKARDVERHAFSRYTLLWLLLPFALTFGERRERVRRLTAVLAPGFVVAFIAPVVAVPERRYETPLDGILVVGLLYAAGWVVQAVSEWSPWLAGRGRAPWPMPEAIRERDPWSLLPGVSVTAVVALTLVPWLIPRSAVSTHAEEIAFYSPVASVLTSPSAVTGPVVSSWSFGRGVPRRWEAPPGWHLQSRQGATRIQPESSTAAFLLRGPTLRLKPGSYRIVVDGRVGRGGLWIGLFDEARKKWLGGAGFWSARGDYAHDRMTVVVQAASRPTQIALAKWGPATIHPSWTITTVSIRRVERNASHK